MVKKKSVTELAIEIFESLGKPLHYRELTKLLIDKSKLKGKTPQESVRSLIGIDERFKRVAEGVYALAEWDEYPTARFAKDIAYDILQKKGVPLTTIVLGQEIYREREFVGAPQAIARSSTRNDPRFYFDRATKEIGLVEWLNE